MEDSTPRHFPAVQNALNKALFVAASVGNNNVSLIRQLLDIGADPNYVDPDAGQSPLIEVLSVAGVHAVVSVLLDHGASPHATSENGIPAIELALRNIDIDVVDLLSQRGANLHISDLDFLVDPHETDAPLVSSFCHCVDIIVRDNAEIDLCTPEMFQYLQWIAEFEREWDPDDDRVDFTAVKRLVQNHESLRQFVQFLSPNTIEVETGLHQLAVEGQEDSIAEGSQPCSICHHHSLKIRFDPCGHSACFQCSENLRERGNLCHVCRQPISRMQRLFLS